MHPRAIRLLFATMTIATATSAPAQDLVMRRPLPHSATQPQQTGGTGPGVGGETYMSLTSCQGGRIEYYCQGQSYDASGAFGDTVFGDAANCLAQPMDAQYARLRDIYREYERVYGMTVHAPSGTTAAAASAGQSCQQSTPDADRRVYGGSCAVDGRPESCTELGLLGSGQIYNVVSENPVDPSLCSASNGISAADEGILLDSGYIPVGNGRSITSWCTAKPDDDYAIGDECSAIGKRQTTCYLANGNGRIWRIACPSAWPGPGLPNSIFTHQEDADEALGGCDDASDVGKGITPYKERYDNAPQPQEPTYFHQYRRERIAGEASSVPGSGVGVQTVTAAYSGYDTCYGDPSPPSASNHSLICGVSRPNPNPMYSDRSYYHGVPLYTVTQTYALRYGCYRWDASKSSDTAEQVEMSNGSCAAEHAADVAALRADLSTVSTAYGQTSTYPIYRDAGDARSIYHFTLDAAYTGNAAMTTIVPPRQNGVMVPRPTGFAMSDDGSTITVSSSFYDHRIPNAVNASETTPTAAGMAAVVTAAKAAIAQYEQTWLEGR
jgi:hypothetical protein